MITGFSVCTITPRTPFWAILEAYFASFLSFLTKSESLNVAVLPAKSVMVISVSANASLSPFFSSVNDMVSSSILSFGVLLSASCPLYLVNPVASGSIPERWSAIPLKVTFTGLSEKSQFHTGSPAGSTVIRDIFGAVWSITNSMPSSLMPSRRLAETWYLPSSLTLRS